MDMRLEVLKELYIKEVAELEKSDYYVLDKKCLEENIELDIVQKSNKYLEEITDNKFRVLKYYNKERLQKTDSDFLYGIQELFRNGLSKENEDKICILAKDKVEFRNYIQKTIKVKMIEKYLEEQYFITTENNAEGRIVFIADKQKLND